ncbi:hypothetical protein GCM10023093_22470 [Nemorincola caseinilytica]|uniref:POTRA domain-containing protein n=1 Tax=Nemorincola caseinilytica TaxID=2054315 RepID=A0ABP8NKF3_9BACT
MSYRLLLLGMMILCAAHVYAQQGRVVVGRIDIEGDRITKRSVILREIGMHEGDIIPRDSLELMVNRNKQRLFNLQLFNEVDQDVVDGRGDTVIWYIRVKERWYIIPIGILQFADRNINTWWADQGHDLRRISAGLTVTDRNFRGALETLSITAQAGYTQKLGLSYILPYVNKQQTHGIGITGSMARSRQIYYTTAGNKLRFAGDLTGPVVWQQAEGGLCYIHRPGYAKKHTIQAIYKRIWVGDTIAMLNPGYFADSSNVARFAEVNYRYEYNGVDNWNYSLRGEKLVATTVARVGMEGIRYQAFVNYEAGIFRGIGKRWYAAAISRGRLMLPQKLPYYFRNGLGTQTDYVRGYEYYVTDGYNYGLLRLDLKKELFSRTWSLPVRYFTAVPVRIYPKVFFDAGYINGPAQNGNTLNNTLMYSIGAGVDIVTLYDVKVRIELARNHLGQNGLYLHFNSE